MSETLRIIHVLRAPVGGLFRHVRDLAREQVRRGHLVGVVCDASTEDPLTRQRLDDLQPSLALGLLQVPMSRNAGLADVSATRAVEAFARRVRVHILHGHGAKGGAYARLAARRVRRSSIDCHAFYTPHGGSLHYDPASLIGRAYMAAERHLARMTSGLIFESAYSARVFREKVGDPACPTRVVHNGITPSELEPIAPDVDAADLLFIGELRMLKGVDVLLDAVKIVAQHRSCSLAIIGAGPDERRFRDHAASLGLWEPQVRFEGAMPAAQALKRGRILVMPSRAESFPYVALEGAGAGLPFITSNVGGLCEIVGDSGALLVPPGNAAALAYAIRETLDQPQKAAERSRRLHERIEQRFTVASMTDGVLGFYAIAAAKGAPAIMPGASHIAA